MPTTVHDISSIKWALWSGTVGFEKPIVERAEAALAAGFSMLSVSPLDIVRAEGEGTTVADLGRQIRGLGLELIMDPVMNWYEVTANPTTTTRSAPNGGGGSTWVQFGGDESLRICEDLEVASLSLVAPLTSDAALGAVVDAFGAVCDRAAAFGARVHVEFIPFTAIGDLATAWEIVSAADRTNGGLLFDTWHFFRGNSDETLLERIPGDRIFAVQIDDAAREVSGTLREDTMRRLLPGEGCFDLERVVGILHRNGGLDMVGPEVISPTLEAMTAVDAAKVSGDLVRELIATVARAS